MAQVYPRRSILGYVELQNFAEHALLTRLRVFDAHEAWGAQGARTCAEWLSWRTNLSIKAAREKVRVARTLGTLPKIDALFGRGGLSYSKVRAITRVATAESEQHWIDVAQRASASQIEKLARAYTRVMGDEASHDPMSRGSLRDRGSRGSLLDRGSRGNLLAQAYLQHQPRTLGSSYEMVVITTPEHLERGPEGVGGYLPDGTPVPLHVARMLACDGARVDVTLGRGGEYVDGSTAPTWDGSWVGIVEALDWMMLAERGLRAA